MGIGPVVGGFGDGLRVDLTVVLVLLPNEVVTGVDFENAIVTGLKSDPVGIPTDLFEQCFPCPDSVPKQASYMARSTRFRLLSLVIPLRHSRGRYLAFRHPPYELVRSR